MAIPTPGRAAAAAGGRSWTDRAKDLAGRAWPWVRSMIPGGAVIGAGSWLKSKWDGFQTRLDQPRNPSWYEYNVRVAAVFLIISVFISWISVYSIAGIPSLGALLDVILFAVVFFFIRDPKWKRMGIVLVIIDLVANLMIAAGGSPSLIVISTSNMIAFRSLFWLGFGIAYFFASYSWAREQGAPISWFLWIIYLFLIILIVAIIWRYIAPQAVTNINYYAEQEQARVLVINFLTPIWEAMKNFLEAFKNLFKGLFLLLKGDIQGAQDAWNPPPEDKLEGSVDKDVQEYVKVQIRDAPFSSSRITTSDSFEAGALLEAYAPENKLITIDVSCTIQDFNKKSYPAKVIATGSSIPISDGISFEKVRRRTEDLLCKPKDTASLPKGIYDVKFQAKIKDIKTDSQLINLFMGEESLRSQIDDYARRLKIVIQNRNQEESVMKTLFPDLISGTYPNGKVESKSTPGFIKPILQTWTLPIVTYTPGLSFGLNLKVGVQNLESGKIGDVKVYLQFPEGIDPTQDCLSQYEPSTVEEGYSFAIKRPVNLDKLTKSQEAQALPSCPADAKDLKLINPNIPQAKVFKSRIVYDYTVEKKVNVQVQQLGGYISSGAEDVRTVTATENQISNYLQRYAGDLLKNKASVFYNSGKKFNVDPAFGVAVARRESSLGNAGGIAQNCNNFFGITIDAVKNFNIPHTECNYPGIESKYLVNGNPRFAQFSTVDAGIEAFFSYFSKQYYPRSQFTASQLVAPLDQDAGSYYCRQSGKLCYCCDDTAGYQGWIRDVPQFRKEVALS